MISILALMLRFAVATVLAVAALAKIRGFDDFRRTVLTLVPRGRMAAPVSAGVIATEGALATLLVAGVVPSAVAAAAAALFLGFAGLSLWAVRTGLQLRCNCFGASDRELGKDSLETSLLLAAAALAYLGLLRAGEPSLSLAEAPVAALLGIVVVLGGRWLIAAGDVLAIVRQRRLLDRELAEPARSAR